MGQAKLFVVAPEAVTRQSLAILGDWMGEDPLAPGVVLAPSGAAGRLLVREAARAWGGAVNLRAATFHGLARSMAAPLTDLRELPPGGDRLIAGEWLRRNPGPLGDQATRPGVAAAFARSLRDLRLAGLWNLPPQDGLILSGEERRRLAHLDRLARAFCAHLETHGLFDEPRLYRTACLGSLPGNARRILIHAVYDFTAVQLEWIESLAREAEISWVMPATEEAALETPGFFQRDAELKERGFVEQEVVTAEGPPAVEILACPGQQAEARAVARRILAAAEEGVPFGEMAVVLVNRDEQEKALLKACDRAGIPIASRPPRRLLDHPQGRLLSALIAVAAGEGTLVQAAALLRAEGNADGDIPPSRVGWLLRRAGCGHPRAAAWPAALFRLAGALQRQAGRFEQAAPEDEDEEEALASPRALRETARQAEALARRAERRLSAIEQFRDRYSGSSWVPAPADWGTLAGDLEELARGLLDDPVLIARAEEAAAGLAGLEGLQVPPTLASALEEFGRRLEAAEAYSTGDEEKASRRPGEGVLLVDLDRARGLTRRRVWVASLGELDFPPRQTPDPLLTDSLRAQIQEAGLGYLPLSTRRAGEAGLLFALIFASATEKLTLSWPRTDDRTGIVRLPADRLARLIESREAGSQPGIQDPQAAAGVTRLGADHPPFRSLGVFLDEEELHLAHCWEAGERAAPPRDPGFRRRIAAWEERWRVCALTAHDGIVGPGTFPAERLGVTSLETYAACPWKFLLSRGMGLEPLTAAEPVPAPDPRDVGNLAHTVLEGVFRGLAEGTLPGEAEWRRRLEDLPGLVKRQLEELLRQGVPGHPALWEAAAKTLHNDLAQFLLEERGRLEAAGRVPSRLEWPKEGTFELEGTLVQIRGQIDRVDKDALGRHFITDYKWARGKGYSPTGLLEGGRRLQLPLYAWLLQQREEGGGTDSRFGGARFAFLRADREKDEVLREAEEIREKSGLLRHLVRHLVQAIRAGHFFPVALKENCDSCDFQVLCGPGRLRLTLMKSADERFRQHAALKDQFK